MENWLKEKPINVFEINDFFLLLEDSANLKVRFQLKVIFSFERGAKFSNELYKAIFTIYTYINESRKFRI